MARYEHTQTGTLIIVALCLAVGLMTVLLIAQFNWIGAAVLVVMGICLCLFHSLTVTVNGDAVTIRFAGGPIRKTFPLRDVASCEVVRNHWYNGWGIRWIPGGWLFNVSGLRAVELRMKTGRRYRIGTDEPEKLANAINTALAQTSK